LITINDKLFITKEINSITVAYVKKLLLRKLLMAFCFESQSNNGTITELFKSLNFYGFDMPYEIELTLLAFLRLFKKNLKKDELTALYFWVLNQKYTFYFEDFLGNCENYSEEKFDEEFGRSLAYKIYEPNASGLEKDIIEELKLLLCNFASEFDLSLVDEYTHEHILEVIDMCRLSSNNSIPVF